LVSGILQGQYASVPLGFFAKVGVLLGHAHHHTLVLWASHDGRENSPATSSLVKRSLHMPEPLSTRGQQYYHPW
jgi:hypothetical protein